MTKSPTGKETLNTRRPEGEVGGERRHVARMREELVSEINTVIIFDPYDVSCRWRQPPTRQRRRAMNAHRRGSPHTPERNMTPPASHTNAVTLTQAKIHVKNPTTRTLCIPRHLYLMAAAFRLLGFLINDSGCDSASPGLRQRLGGGLSMQRGP